MGAGLFSTTPIILLLFHGLPSLLPPPLLHIYIHYKSSTNSACISVFCALSPSYLGLVRVTVWGLRPEAFPDITRLHWGLNFLVLALHFPSAWRSDPADLHAACTSLSRFSVPCVLLQGRSWPGEASSPSPWTPSSSLPPHLLHMVTAPPPCLAFLGQFFVFFPCDHSIAIWYHRIIFVIFAIISLLSYLEFVVRSPE